jgi:hypothetical protein
VSPTPSTTASSETVSPTTSAVVSASGPAVSPPCDPLSAQDVTDAPSDNANTIAQAILDDTDVIVLMF